MAIYYDEITAAAARTLRKLSEQAAGRLSEESQAWWDMGRGAIQCWDEAVGDDAMPEDRRHLALLLAEISGADDPGLITCM